MGNKAGPGIVWIRFGVGGTLNSSSSSALWSEYLKRNGGGQDAREINRCVQRYLAIVSGARSRLSWSRWLANDQLSSRESSFLWRPPPRHATLSLCCPPRSASADLADQLGGNYALCVFQSLPLFFLSVSVSVSLSVCVSVSLHGSIRLGKKNQKKIKVNNS